MKEIKAIIQPHMLHRVIDALHRFKHFPGLTIMDVQGQGRGRGPDGHYEATADSIFLAKKIRLEIFCNDEVADHIVQTIQRAAHTGNVGDGLIAVSDTERVVRIRSGEVQQQAV